MTIRESQKRSVKFSILIFGDGDLGRTADNQYSTMAQGFLGTSSSFPSGSHSCACDSRD